MEKVFLSQNKTLKRNCNFHSECQTPNEYFNKFSKGAYWIIMKAVTVISASADY